MQKVTINSQKVDHKIDDCESLQVGLDKILKENAKDDEVLIKLMVDGAEIDLDNPTVNLDEAFNNYKEIDITLKDKDDLIDEAIESCFGYIDYVVNKIKVLVECYRNNENEEGNQIFLEVVDVLDLFIQLMTHLHQALKVNPDTKINDEMTFQGLQIHLLSILKGLLPAKEKKDFIMLCDLLEYELIDNLDQWKVNAIPKIKALRSA